LLTFGLVGQVLMGVLMDFLEQKDAVDPPVRRRLLEELPGRTAADFSDLKMVEGFEIVGGDVRAMPLTIPADGEEQLLLEAYAAFGSKSVKIALTMFARSVTQISEARNFSVIGIGLSFSSVKSHPLTTPIMNLVSSSSGFSPCPLLCSSWVYLAGQYETESVSPVFSLTATVRTNVR
jgi:hypothetical protein